MAAVCVFLTLAMLICCDRSDIFYTISFYRLESIVTRLL
jgi:hypothetical protein